MPKGKDNLPLNQTLASTKTPKRLQIRLKLTPHLEAEGLGRRCFTPPKFWCRRHELSSEVEAIRHVLGFPQLENSKQKMHQDLAPKQVMEMKPK